MPNNNNKKSSLLKAGGGGGGGGGKGGKKSVVAVAAPAFASKRGGKIAKAFPKSYKNKAKSLEYVKAQREREARKEKKKVEEDDEKNYELDLGEALRRAESGRNTNTSNGNKRVGYASAKGKRGGGRTINQKANLADLDLADEETVRYLLDSLPVSHYEERERKADNLFLRWPEWFRYLTHDFSVLLYGFGSKKQVLEDFAKKYLLDGAVVVVNGYQQRVSALAILNQCVFALSDESENISTHHNNNGSLADGISNNNNNNNSNSINNAVANNAQALLRRIAELTVDYSHGGEKTTENDFGTMHNITNNATTMTGTTASTMNTRASRREYGGVNNSNDALALRDGNINNDRDHHHLNDGGSASRLYIVVHNIDGVAMRNAETQSILGELSSFPRVHLIASVDHVNAPLLWSKREAAKFNWIYQKAVTFAPYAMETANDPQLLASKGEERHVRGAANVLKSLTRNARIIYRIIAEAQIAENGQGLTFPQLFQASRESFLVTAELALRGVLTEFTDHELIRIKKVSDGGEDLITVPMDNNALEQLIEDECEEINNFF